MVKAHYQNDLNEYKRFGIFHTLRARWWYIAMLSGLFLVCGAGLLALGILRGDAAEYQRSSSACAEYVRSHKGATGQIIAGIRV